MTKQQKGQGLGRKTPAKGGRVHNRMTVNITIDDELLEAVRKRAQRDYLSFAAVARILLRKGLEVEVRQEERG